MLSTTAKVSSVSDRVSSSNDDGGSIEHSGPCGEHV